MIFQNFSKWRNLVATGAFVRKTGDWAQANLVTLATAILGGTPENGPGELGHGICVDDNPDQDSSTKRRNSLGAALSTWLKR